MLVVFGSIAFGVFASLNPSLLSHFLFRGVFIVCGAMVFKSAFFGRQGIALSEAFGMIIGCLTMAFFLMYATWHDFARSVLWALGIAVLWRTLE
jgi:hypothetical protein